MDDGKRGSETLGIDRSFTRTDDDDGCQVLGGRGHGRARSKADDNAVQMI